VILHVAPGGNSDGSIESPYGSLAAAFGDARFAQGNIVVYDRTQGTYTGTVHFRQGTRLLSSGPMQSLNTLDGLIALPFSGSGAGKMPTINGTVVLASHSTVSGFDLRTTTGQAAIKGKDTATLKDVTIANNKVSGTGTGVQLGNVAGQVEIRSNRIDTAKSHAVSLAVDGENRANVVVCQNQITQPTGDGVRVEVGGKSVATVDVQGNTITNATGNGVKVTTKEDSMARVHANVKDNHIGESGLFGQGAIVLDAMGKNASSKLTATVDNNELSENHRPGVTARSGGTNTLGLDLFDNKALSSDAMFSFLLQQKGKSKFNVVDADRLGANNIGSIVTTGTITNTKSVR
jgi:hypothetical protein